MRFEGSLKKWSPDRGFGFIEASHGGPELFVHVSALTCDGRVPLVGDALSFEVDIDREGRKRAVRVRRSRPVLTLASLPEGHANRRDGGTGAWRPSRPARPARKSGRTGAGFTSSLIGFGIVLALGWFGYEKFSARLQLQSGNGSGQNQPALALPAATPVNPFQCTDASTARK